MVLPRGASLVRVGAGVCHLGTAAGEVGSAGRAPQGRDRSPRAHVPIPQSRSWRWRSSAARRRVRTAAAASHRDDRSARGAGPGDRRERGVRCTRAGPPRSRATSISGSAAARVIQRPWARNPGRPRAREPAMAAMRRGMCGQLRPSRGRRRLPARLRPWGAPPAIGSRRSTAAACVRALHAGTGCG